MKSLFLLMLASFLICLGCNSNVSNEPSGKYAYEGLSYISEANWLLKGKRKFFAGTKLDLNEDQSFSFSTCGCKTVGDWEMVLDTIYLAHQIIETNTDSLQCYLPNIYLYKNNYYK